MEKCFLELHYFSKKLHDRRFELDISQEKLAELVDCHHNAIGRLERAQAYPSFSMIILLARALKISPRDLLPE